ncbi:glycosyltransferase [Nocardioides jejuensis]|nr:glycosyltransferase [Nocardioides jejuensis]
MAELRVIASNLHRGGAVQVAASLIGELAARPDFDRSRVVFEVSPAVLDNLTGEVRERVDLDVVRRGVRSVGLWRTDLGHDEPAKLVVFSPAWFPVRGARRLSGYADVTALYAEAQPTRRARAKAWLSRHQLRRFDTIVVETQAVADRLTAQVPQLASRLHVVPNSISGAVVDGTAPIPELPAFDGVTLAYTSANYPHKNFAYLGPLAAALADRGVEVRYLVTMPTHEFEQLPGDVQARAINLGTVRQEQLRSVHAAADGIVFPSLLEASSATPFEAMRLGTPLFASDRDFVRATAGDAAHYLDPLDPADGARVIADVLGDGPRRAAAIERGLARVATLPSAGDRADRIWSLLTSPAAEPPRLLIVNNMPAFYRSPLYAAIADEFRARTGGQTLVVFQVRRARRERGEWFYTPDGDHGYAHRFVQDDYAYLAGRKLPTRPGSGLLRRYAPTHVFTAGWDTSLSLAASRRALRRGVRLAVWVESSSLTTTRRSRLLDAVRRSWLAPADLAVVPSAASAAYVDELAQRHVPDVRLLNPVTLDRLAGTEAAPRVVFLGDLSLRKGFDRLVALAAKLGSGIEVHAWGRDTDGLAAGGVVVHPPVPLAEIVAELTSADVLVIPSRVDPAPLTFSEGLALGLRIVVSTDISYAEQAGPGVVAADCDDPASFVVAVEDVLAGERPPASRGADVSPEHFAKRLVDGLLA